MNFWKWCQWKGCRVMTQWPVSSFWPSQIILARFVLVFNGMFELQANQLRSRNNYLVNKVTSICLDFFTKGKCVKSCIRGIILTTKKWVQPHMVLFLNKICTFWSHMQGHVFKIQRFAYVGNRDPGPKGSVCSSNITDQQMAIDGVATRRHKYNV